MPRTIAIGRQLSVGRNLAVARRLRVPSLLNNLMAYWSLEEASGTRIDATGRGNNLADINTVTQNPGRVGNAAQFTAANLEALTHADNADLSTGDIAWYMSGWLYTDSIAAGNAVVLSQRDPAVSSGYILFRSTATLTWQVYDGTANGSIGAVNAPTSLTASTWYFFEVYHDPVANLVAIALNGAAWTTSATTGAAGDSTAEFALGRRVVGLYWGGRIDEVGFWKRILTTAERTWLYNGGAGRSYAEIVAHG